MPEQPERRDVGHLTIEEITRRNTELARQSHARARGESRFTCYFGCDADADTFCQRVNRVVRNDQGLVIEVQWDRRR